MVHWRRILKAIGGIAVVLVSLEIILISITLPVTYCETLRVNGIVTKSGCWTDKKAEFLVILGLIFGVIGLGSGGFLAWRAVHPRRLAQPHSGEE